MYHADASQSSGVLMLLLLPLVVDFGAGVANAVGDVRVAVGPRFCRTALILLSLPGHA